MGYLNEYVVRGMTCQHCAMAVTEEIERLPGVASVEVDVPAGRVTVASERALEHDEVAAAVDEAGYELVAA